MDRTIGSTHGDSDATNRHALSGVQPNNVQSFLITEPIVPSIHTMIIDKKRSPGSRRGTLINQPNQG
jgi:hypothetical protein